MDRHYWFIASTWCLPRNVEGFKRVVSFMDATIEEKQTDDDLRLYRFYKDDGERINTYNPAEQEDTEVDDIFDMIRRTLAPGWAVAIDTVIIMDGVLQGQSTILWEGGDDVNGYLDDTAIEFREQHPDYKLV